MKYYIPVNSTLIEKKHIENMGSAVWLFMWCLDKMTKIKEGNGKVLGGKPITYEEISEAMGISRRTYSRWLETLRTHGYIDTIRTPNGMTIIVKKAVKGYAKNGTSDVPKMSSDVPHMAQRYAKNGTSNIREYKDNTKIISKNDFRGIESPAKERIREWLKSRA